MTSKNKSLKLNEFNNSSLKKLAKALSKKLKSQQLDVNGVRETAANHYFKRSFADEAIQAWIEGRNIPGGEVLHSFSQAVGMSFTWVFKAQDSIKRVNSQAISAEQIMVLDQLMDDHDLVTLQALLNKGLPVDLVYKDQACLLSKALEKNWTGGVETLLSWGASALELFDQALASEHNGLIAPFIPHIAGQSRPPGQEYSWVVCKLCHLPEDPEALIQKYLPICQLGVNAFDYKALHIAVKNKYYQATQYLLDYGLSPELCNEQKTTTLVLAAENDDSKMIELLLRAGAFINKIGSNVLLNAVRQCASEKTLHTLVRHGANGLDKAIKYCQEKDLSVQLNALENAPPNGPTWYRQAKERGIKQIEIHYSQANGLLFYPQDIDQSIGIGGSYNGTYPTNATDALKRFKYELELKPDNWFIPYAEKMAQLIDFSLDEFFQHDFQCIIYTNGETETAAEIKKKQFHHVTEQQEQSLTQTEEVNCEVVEPEKNLASVNHLAESDADKTDKTRGLVSACYKYSTEIIFTGILLILLMGLAWLFGRFSVVHSVDLSFFIGFATMIVVGVYLILIDAVKSQKTGIVIGLLCSSWIVLYGHVVATDLHVEEVSYLTCKNSDSNAVNMKQLNSKECYLEFLERRLGYRSYSRILAHLQYRAQQGIFVRGVYTSSLHKVQGNELWFTWGYQAVLLLIFGGYGGGLSAGSKNA